MKKARDPYQPSEPYVIAGGMLYELVEIEPDEDGPGARYLQVYDSMGTWQLKDTHCVVLFDALVDAQKGRRETRFYTAEERGIWARNIKQRAIMTHKGTWTQERRARGVLP